MVDPDGSQVTKRRSSDRKLTVDRAQDAIRRLILTGRYSAGSRLKEEELASVTGVSRTPIREALLRLQAEGLVEFQANRGAMVTSWKSESIEYIFELRALLEGFGAQEAAKSITEAQLATLSDLANQMDAAMALGTGAGMDEVALLNNRFHRMIMEVGGSEKLADLQRTVVQLPLVQRTFHQYTPEERARSMRHHREIVEALAVGDPDWASAIMRAHVLSARHVARRAQGVVEE